MFKKTGAIIVLVKNSAKVCIMFSIGLGLRNKNTRKVAIFFNVTATKYPVIKFGAGNHIAAKDPKYAAKT